MIVIDTVRIYSVDKFCYSFDFLKSVKKKETGLTEKEWFSSKKYYGTLVQTLDGVKEHLIKEKIELEIYSIDGFIKEINKLKNAIVKIDLQAREDGEE